MISTHLVILDSKIINSTLRGQVFDSGEHINITAWAVDEDIYIIFDAGTSIDENNHHQGFGKRYDIYIYEHIESNYYKGRLVN